MPILRITADETGPRLHGTDAPILPALRAALASDPGPVTVMIHGFKYAPGHKQHCPYGAILSDRPDRSGPRIVGWPRRLGLRGQPGEGLGLGFGWPARASIWTAYARAAEAGAQLAAVMRMLRGIDAARPIRLIGHSLGVRVALSAIARSAPGTVSRAVLLSAAEYRTTARAALDTPGGRDCAVLNVTSRENDLFDFLFERCIPRPCAGDTALGLGGLNLPNAVTLQLDHGSSLAALRGLGHPLGAPQHRVCHWSPYLRAGAFPLYRAFLSGRLGVDALRIALPEQTAPRWSRLRPALRIRAAPEASALP